MFSSCVSCHSKPVLKPSRPKHDVTSESRPPSCSHESVGAAGHPLKNDGQACYRSSRHQEPSLPLLRPGWHQMTMARNHKDLQKGSFSACTWTRRKSWLRVREVPVCFYAEASWILQLCWEPRLSPDFDLIPSVSSDWTLSIQALSTYSPWPCCGFTSEANA